MKKNILISTLLFTSSIQATTCNNNTGASEIHHFAGRGWISGMQKLINKGINVNIETKSKATPLHFAAYNNMERSIPFLIKNGANINAITLCGWSPMTAALSGRDNNIINIKAIKALVNNGANINDKGENNGTVLHLAISSLGQSRSHAMPEGWGVKEQDNRLREFIAWAVKMNANLEAKDHYKTTPLLRAVMKNESQLVILLLKNKANVNAKVKARDKKDLTPLSWAIKNKKSAMETILRKYGAKN